MWLVPDSMCQLVEDMYFFLLTISSYRIHNTVLPYTSLSVDSNLYKRAVRPFYIKQTFCSMSSLLWQTHAQFGFWSQVQPVPNCSNTTISLVKSISLEQPANKTRPNISTRHGYPGNLEAWSPSRCLDPVVQRWVSANTGVKVGRGGGGACAGPHEAKRFAWWDRKWFKMIQNNVIVVGFDNFNAFLSVWRLQISIFCPVEHDPGPPKTLECSTVPILLVVPKSRLDFSPGP